MVGLGLAEGEKNGDGGRVFDGFGEEQVGEEVD